MNFNWPVTDHGRLPLRPPRWLARLVCAVRGHDDSCPWMDGCWRCRTSNCEMARKR